MPFTRPTLAAAGVLAFVTTLGTLAWTPGSALAVRTWLALALAATAQRAHTTGNRARMKPAAWGRRPARSSTRFVTGRHRRRPGRLRRAERALGCAGAAPSRPSHRRSGRSG